MRFFRGISVPADAVASTIESIFLEGLQAGDGDWSMEHKHPGDLGLLLRNPDLSLEQTRNHTKAVPAVCACGEETGAWFYASRHNKTSDNDTPILIEFEAIAAASAIDGKDFLYSIFQMGDAERAHPMINCCYGTSILQYAEAAWRSENQERRIALCDLAIHDRDVIRAHYANRAVLGGRYRTVFRNAFTVALPVRPENIRRVWCPRKAMAIPNPTFLFSDFLRA